MVIFRALLSSFEAYKSTRTRLGRTKLGSSRSLKRPFNWNLLELFNALFQTRSIPSDKYKGIENDVVLHIRADNSSVLKNVFDAFYFLVSKIS